MDTRRIENLSAGARTDLIREIGATLKRISKEGSSERLHKPIDVQKIEDEIIRMGEVQLIEYVAYTWFNRLCALRFMDVRGYTPIGIVSPRDGATTPAILSDAGQGMFVAELEVSSELKIKIGDLLSGVASSNNPLNDVYKELLRATCEHYRKSMSYLFGKSDNLSVAVSLLMPDDLVSESSIVKRICFEMDEEACESVEVLGWLYQYYIAERKDEVFAGFKKNKKAGPAELAPATQLFTPNWIVRYMVENSLGRLWMLNRPDSSLREKMQYYIAADTQETEYLRIASPEEIKCLDPACGSGHILVYMFDLLFEMYEEEGYLPKDIPEKILRNNLRGYEIDARAAEIASFALEMKALERDSDFLSKDIDANITVLKEVEFDSLELEQLAMLQARPKLVETLAHLNEVGSLFKPDPSDMLIIQSCKNELESKSDLYSDVLKEKLTTAISNCEELSREFDVVVANPPYMGSKNMNTWLSNWLKENYPDEKSDLCTCFIERGFSLAKQGGYSAMVTMESWMFLSSFEKMREKIIANKSIVSLLYMNHMVMRIAFNTSATVFINAHYDNSLGIYTQVKYKDLNENQEPPCFPIPTNHLFARSTENFKSIPGTPIAYWASDALIKCFTDGTPLGEIASPRVGLQTGDNALFLRLWWEVAENKSGYEFESSEAALESGLKWFPYNKGGEFRKWYGNNDYVVDWSNDGYEIKHFVDSSGNLRSRPQNITYYFKPSITWSNVSSGSIAFRHKPIGHIFDTTGPSIFADFEGLILLEGFCNSGVTSCIAKIISPTLHFNVGEVAIYPVISVGDKSSTVINLVNLCTEISKNDWDAFETSWDFTHHPLI